MRNITNLFRDVYHPAKALLVYRSALQERECYVEAYDMDEQGRPVNATPLSEKEMQALVKRLETQKIQQNRFLLPVGLMPPGVLRLQPFGEGYAIWHTPSQQVSLFFVESLTIPCGKAHVPALVWKASVHGLEIYAVREADKLTEKTALYHAPFFNVYPSGGVCMGTVATKTAGLQLEAFMRQWEHYFWNSYFSHLQGSHNPVEGNIVQLWQKLVGSGKPFPEKCLKKNGKTIQSLF